MDQNGIWLSIAEYSNLNNISISTIRRRIKAKRLVNKMVDGKYEIYISSDNINAEDADKLEIFKLKKQNSYLLDEIHRYRKNIDELKMLVQLYEKLIVSNDLPPSLPPKTPTANMTDS